MDKTKEHLDNLSEIRSIMEQSSRFLSLSGLSGVFAGIFALIGAGTAYWYFGYNLHYKRYYTHVLDNSGSLRLEFLLFLFGVAAAVFFLAIGTGYLLTVRKAKKSGEKIWTPTAKRMLINLAIPLATGGVFCIALLYNGDVYHVAPATLIFYGLALLNASKYTLPDIRYLGISEIILGLLNAFFVGYGLLFWTIGFGLLHIIYGITMYNKYDK